MATIDEQERNLFRDILKVLRNIDSRLETVTGNQERLGIFLKDTLLTDMVKEIRAIMNHPDGFRHFYQNGLSPENKRIETAIKSLLNYDDPSIPMKFEHYLQNGFIPQHKELMARLDQLEARCCPQRRPGTDTTC